MLLRLPRRRQTTHTWEQKPTLHCLSPPPLLPSPPRNGTHVNTHRKNKNFILTITKIQVDHKIEKQILFLLLVQNETTMGCG